MNVLELIKKLKKMPKDMMVGVAMHDNSEGEVAGWVCDVYQVKEKIPTRYMDNQYTEGDEVVILHC